MQTALTFFADHWAVLSALLGGHLSQWKLMPYLGKKLKAVFAAAKS